MKNIKISKVELVIGEKKISLTIEEAVELKQLLSRTFDSEDPYPLYPCYTYIADPSFDTTTETTDHWMTSSSGDTLILSCS